MTTIAEPDLDRPSLTLEKINVGDLLPELVVDVSTRTIVSTALASRDYQDVHHDVDMAKQRGSKTIFMNILSSNGYCLRFVTDWAGPEAIVKTSSIRLGVPNYAGDEMVMRGEVTRVEDLGEEGLVEVDVVGRNSLGNHVTGTVGITVPKAVA